MNNKSRRGSRVNGTLTAVAGSLCQPSFVCLFVFFPELKGCFSRYGSPAWYLSHS